MSGPAEEKWNYQRWELMTLRRSPGGVSFFHEEWRISAGIKDQNTGTDDPHPLADKNEGVL